MRENWEIKTLAEVCSSINGLWKGKKDPFVKVGVIRNANFTKQFTLDFSNIEYLEVEERQYKTRKLFKGDLIIEKSGGSDKWPVGRPVLFEKEEGEFSFSNFTSVLRIKNFEILSPKYLHYYLVFGYFRGDTRKLQSNTTGLHNLDFKTYLSISVPVPPLSEQTAIVEKLDLEFAKIDLLKNNAQKQLDEAKALFQSTLKQLLEPKEGWEEKRLKEITVSATDGDHMPPPKSEKGIPFITISNIDKDNRFINFENTFFVPKNYFENITKERKPQKNDILYTVTGSFGITINVNDDREFCFQRHIALIRPDTEIISNYFLNYWLSSPAMQSVADSVATGAAQRTVSLTSMRNFIIRFPKSLDEQKSIVEKLDAISSKIKKLEENYKNILTHCDDLKQAILREIFG